MWIIILTTIFVAFASGISMGLYLEREIWEAALRSSAMRLNAAEGAAAPSGRIRIFAGVCCRIPVTFLQKPGSAVVAGNDNAAPTQPASSAPFLIASQTKR